MKFLAIFPVVLLSVLAQSDRTEFRLNFCVLCQAGIQKILQKAFSTQAEMKQYLDNYCDEEFQSGTWEDSVCKTVFNKAVPWLYQEILKNPNLDPKQLCADIDLCSKVQQIQTKQKPGYFCTMCQAEINAIEKALQGQQIVMDRVEQYFIEACNVIPEGTSREMCVHVIDEYFPDLWRKILGLIDPNVICSDLKLCPVSPTGLETLQGSFGRLGCSFCRTTFRWFKAQFKKPRNQQAILNELDRVCSLSSDDFYQEMCNNLIQEYGSVLLKKVSQLITPGAICQDIQMCPANL